MSFEFYIILFSCLFILSFLILILFKSKFNFKNILKKREKKQVISDKYSGNNKYNENKNKKSEKKKKRSKEENNNLEEYSSSNNIRPIMKSPNKEQEENEVKLLEMAKRPALENSTITKANNSKDNKIGEENLDSLPKLNYNNERPNNFSSFLDSSKNKKGSFDDFLLKEYKNNNFKTSANGMNGLNENTLKLINEEFKKDSKDSIDNSFMKKSLTDFNNRSIPKNNLRDTNFNSFENFNKKFDFDDEFSFFNKGLNKNIRNNDKTFGNNLNVKNNFIGADNIKPYNDYMSFLNNENKNLMGKNNLSKNRNFDFDNDLNLLGKDDFSVPKKRSAGLDKNSFRDYSLLDNKRKNSNFDDFLKVKESDIDDYSFKTKTKYSNDNAFNISKPKFSNLKEEPFDDENIDLNKLPPNLKKMIIKNILSRRDFD